MAKEIRINLAVDGTGSAVVSLEKVDSKIKDMAGSAKQSGSAIKSFGSQVAGSFNLTAMAAGAVVGALMSSVSAAMEADRAAYRLSAVYGKSSDALIAFARERQKLTVYEDDATVAAMARIAMNVKDEAGIKSLTVAAQNLATATGRDLSTASEALAKAAGGSSSALMRMNIKMDTTNLSAVELASKINDVTNNAAELEGKTAGGQMTQALNEWGNAWEDIGTILLPLAPVIQGISLVVSQAAASLVAFGEGIAGVALLLTGEFKAALKVFADSWDTYTGPIVRLLGLNEEVKTSTAQVADVVAAATDQAVAGFLEQAEAARANDEAILALQKDHAGVAKELGLQTRAQKKAAEAAKEHAEAVKKLRKEREEETRRQKENSRTAQRLIEDYRAGTWTLEEQAAYWQAIANKTQEATEKAQIQIKVWELQKAILEESTEKTKTLRQADADWATETANNTYTQNDFNAQMLQNADDEANQAKMRKRWMRETTDGQVAYRDAVLSGTSQMLGAFSNLAAQNKSTAVAAKRMAQASAIIDTYAGADKAFAQGGVLGFVTGAAIIASGLANVAMIEQQQFASGGYVRGHGGSRSDVVPAQLSAGEGVLNAATVARIGGEAAINRLNAGGGAGGGITIQFNGPVTDRAYVRDYIVPEVRRAVGRAMA